MAKSCVWRKGERERGKREKVRILTIILFRGLGLGFLREVQIGMGNICLDGSKGFFRHQKIKYKEPPLKKKFKFKKIFKCKTFVSNWSLGLLPEEEVSIGRRLQKKKNAN
jgi:hypothetical protein